MGNSSGYMMFLGEYEFYERLKNVPSICLFYEQIHSAHSREERSRYDDNNMVVMMIEDDDNVVQVLLFIVVPSLVMK